MRPAVGGACTNSTVVVSFGVGDGTSGEGGAVGTSVAVATSRTGVAVAVSGITVTVSITATGVGGVSVGNTAGVQPYNNKAEPHRIAEAATSNSLCLRLRPNKAPPTTAKPSTNSTAAAM